MPGASRRQNALPFKQLEFSFEAADRLPSAQEMRDRAVRLLHGVAAEGLAARLSIEWNARMRTSVGRADFRRCLIALNPALQKFGAFEIDRTLRHELAHLLAQFRSGRRRVLPHGREWRKACRDLGIDGEHACHKLPLSARELRRRFIYHCRTCQRHFPRVRRIRRATACLACCRKFAHGNYDERFQLQLVKKLSLRSFRCVFSKSPQ